MIIIKVFCDFNDDILDFILNQYNWKNDSNYNSLYKFTKNNDFTHAIILNCYDKKIDLPKENIIGLAQEPMIYLPINNNFIEYCKNNIKKYYIGNIKKNNLNLPDPFIEKWSYLLPMIKSKYFINDFSLKTKSMNYVYSKKRSNDNNILYNYRHILGKSILDKYFPIDIYGTVVKSLKSEYKWRENIKFKFDWDDVYKIYENYKFSIVIENTRDPEYFTEKIIIPLLCGCIPIYLGCLNINNYFKEYVINLTGNLEEDLKIIEEILNNPNKYYKKIDINEIEDIIHLKNLIYKEFLK